MSWDRWGDSPAKYYCRGKNGVGPCPIPRARIDVPEIDAQVEARFLCWLEEQRVQGVQTDPEDSELTLAQARVAARRREFDALRNNSGRYIAEFGAHEYFQQVDQHRSALQAALNDLDHCLAANVISDPQDLAREWPNLSVDLRRQHLHSVYGAVFLRHEDDEDGNPRDFDDRVRIVSRSQIDDMMADGRAPRPKGVSGYARIMPIEFGDEQQPQAAESSSAEHER
jgi:hypothetical protein